MSFTSLTFFIFLVLVFTTYWRFRSRGVQNWILLVSGYVFYSWWNPYFSFLMLFSSVVDYVASWQIYTGKRRKAWLGVSLVANLGLLGFFKYFNFFYDSLVELLNAIGFTADHSLLAIVLPVGISFYTFQTMSYTIDVYRGRIKPTRNFVDYSAYVSFFPQLVAGPIERAERLLTQLESPRHFNEMQAKDGVRQILWGVFKKLAIADNLGMFVTAVYNDPSLASGSDLTLATIAFGIQIYCDFSAYSDIAIGTAKLFGIQLMRNFAFPYFSRSIDEFWRRWHISLHLWFRDYVYFPLGGSKSGRGKQVRNILITFTLSGLWHGASWNFIIWGFLNGLAAVPAIFNRDPSKRIHAEDVPSPHGWLPRYGDLLKMIGVCAFVCLTWVFFRARTFGEAMTTLQRIATWAPQNSLLGEVPLVNGFLWVGIVPAGVFVLIEWFRRWHEHPFSDIDRLPRVFRWVIYTVFLWVVFYLMAPVSSPFIYFQF